MGKKNRQRPLTGSVNVWGGAEPLAEWERELLLGQTPERSRRGGARVRPSARLRANQKRLNSLGKKPKTAADAEFSRRQAASHKRGGMTSEYKPRKSRRALKRELYGTQSGD